MIISSSDSASGDARCGKIVWWPGTNCYESLLEEKLISEKAGREEEKVKILIVGYYLSERTKGITL